MGSAQGPGMGDGEDLEQRLRGMIFEGGRRAGNGPVDREVHKSGESVASVVLQHPPTGQRQPSAASWTSRKRPNQAQRRQLASQLTIPVDPRPWAPEPSDHGRKPWQNSNSKAHNSAGHWPMHGSHGGINRAGTPPSGPLPPQNWSRSTVRTSSLTNHSFRPSPGSRHDSQPDNGPHWMHRGPLNSTMSGEAVSDVLSFRYSQEQAIRNAQAEALDTLCRSIVAEAEIQKSDLQAKENFRRRIEVICQEVIIQHEREKTDGECFPAESVQLKCFGSLLSGFATKAADMDLGLLSPLSQPQPDDPSSSIPQLIEKTFLARGLGARLLSKTRVPIIKVCEKPPESLLKDLVEARAKLDQGLSIDGGETNDDAKHEDERESLAHETSQAKDAEQKPKQGPLTVDSQMDALNQKGKMFANYVAGARSLLRKLFGHDLNQHNEKACTDHHFKQLNLFCLKFVRGLADEPLRTRLLNYRNLKDHDLLSLKIRRSFYSVSMQVEGERMVMLWESGDSQALDNAREAHAQNEIKKWMRLHNEVEIKCDLGSFNRDVAAASDRIRRLPTVQMMLLEQDKNETAAVYYGRTLQILRNLGGRDKPQDKKVLPILLPKYVDGIYQRSLREEVRAFAQAQVGVTLSAVGQRHKALQLALEFESVLGKVYYSEQEAAAVQKYTELLRAPLAPDHLVPVPLELMEVVNRVSHLKQPAATLQALRDPFRDRLDFPATDIGVQCDINFSAHLALHNSQLLRCYSYTDPRVRPLVLFIKYWAKVRQINTPYRGTLSSYGYVLMVLHFLVNVASPFVCPNLQLLKDPMNPHLPPDQLECRGHDVRFWRDEAQILRLARANELNTNSDSIGHLLRGFFEYFAQSNQRAQAAQARGFDWGREVLCLRVPGGIVPKQAKGWTEAKTTVEYEEAKPSPVDVRPCHPQTVQMVGPSLQPPPPRTTNKKIKEVRHRFLFAIEDPFETDHNVARTVTHNGIVAIRDEFRRAWRIIKGGGPVESLLMEAEEESQETGGLREVMLELHGNEVMEGIARAGP